MDCADPSRTFFIYCPKDSFGADDLEDSEVTEAWQTSKNIHGKTIMSEL